MKQNKNKTWQSNKPHHNDRSKITDSKNKRNALLKIGDCERIPLEIRVVMSLRYNLRFPVLCVAFIDSTSDA